MIKKIWKFLLMVFFILALILLTIGIGLLIWSSMQNPSQAWLDENNQKLTLVQFDNSTIYVTGGLLLAISFILFSFLIINFFIRKRMINDLGAEKANEKVQIDLKKYGFLLAHWLPYTKKQKDILKGIVK